MSGASTYAPQTIWQSLLLIRPLVLGSTRMHSMPLLIKSHSSNDGL
jgi:hypothetical protein